MIDEELYQFATDELNSDRRDSELWNRACALARDDHDEARFLYTNLRVEELLEQKANGEPMPDMPESVKGAASVAFDLDAAPNAVQSAPLGLGSALEAGQSEPDVGAAGVISSSNRAFSDNSNADLSEDLVFELQSSNQANASDDDALIPDASQLAKEAADEAEITLDPSMFPEPIENSDTPTSTPGTESKLDLGDIPAEFDLDAVSALNSDNPLSADVDKEIASLAEQASEKLQGSASARSTRPLNADSAANSSLPDTAADEVPQSTTLTENELAFLDASIEKGRDDIIDQQRQVIHQKDALTEELERQADSFLPEDSAALVTNLAESDLLSDSIDLDSINTRSANIEAVAGSVDAPMAGANAAASAGGSAAASTNLDEVFSDDNLEQIRAQHNASVTDFTEADIDGLTQNGSVSDYASHGAELLDDAPDAISGVVSEAVVIDADDNLASGGSESVGKVISGGAGAVALGGTALAASAAFTRDSGSQISQDFSQPGNLDFDNDNPSLDRAELLSGKGQTYRVFSKGPDNNRAAKTGVSWAALFFTLPWLLVKRMPLMAIVYALLWVIVAAGLLVTGLQWLDAPNDVRNTLAIWPLAFAALAVIGLIVLPFFMANRWHARSLEKRGYEEIALVRAKDPRRAIDRIMQMAS